MIWQLVSEDYEGLVKRCPGSRCTAGEIRAAIEQYGRTFIMPPTLDDEKHLTKVQVEHTEYLTWHVTAPLWTVEEGRSDLEIQLLIELGDKAPQIEICNVRVP